MACALWQRRSVSLAPGAAEAALGREPVALGDLTLTQVLQGFKRDLDFDTALRLMAAVPVIDIAGEDIAIQAARNLRRRRTLGGTVRKTIDTPIATGCIAHGHALLFSDRAFEPLADQLRQR